MEDLLFEWIDTRLGKHQELTIYKQEDTLHHLRGYRLIIKTEISRTSTTFFKKEISYDDMLDARLGPTKLIIRTLDLMQHKIREDMCDEHKQIHDKNFRPKSI